MKLWHDVRALNALSNLLMALAALAILGALVQSLIRLPAFDLRALVVESVDDERPLQHVNRVLLRAGGVAQLHGNFFTVDLDAVRASFEAVPWVRRAQVRRVWPNALKVQVEEHEPIAVWGDGRLVNRQGELFAANVAEAEAEGILREFSGPPDSAPEVARRWVELEELLTPLNLRPVAVSVSPRWAWSARLDNGVTLLLGREQGLPLDDRVRRWAMLQPALNARLRGEIVSVDLRYPNGFAVRAPGALEREVPRSGAHPNTHLQ
jgi:cell division protein FtsQ